MQVCKFLIYISNSIADQFVNTSLICLCFCQKLRHLRNRVGHLFQDFTVNLLDNIRLKISMFFCVFVDGNLCLVNMVVYYAVNAIGSNFHDDLFNLSHFLF